jgi:hypothetical protein
MIIIFFYLRINKNSEEVLLKLQEQEVEKAIWINLEKIYEVLTTSDAKNRITIRFFISIQKNLKWVINYILNFLLAIFNENVKTFYSQNEYAELNLLTLKEIYPNQFGEGLGEAHREAIKFFFEKNRKKIWLIYINIKLFLK